MSLELKRCSCKIEKNIWTNKEFDKKGSQLIKMFKKCGFEMDDG